MKFRALVLELHLPQNFCHTHTDTQTHSHFPEIVKSCSAHTKTYTSIKNRKSKICTKPIFSPIYTQESKNDIIIVHLLLQTKLNSVTLICFLIFNSF